MSKADEMFEKLGYDVYLEKSINSKETTDIFYKTNSESKKYIHFDLIDRCFLKYVKYGSAISIKELQAIHEKCKELGWIE